MTTPIRGGNHPIYGIFMGGSDLADDYTLKSSMPYKFMTQLRNPKQSSVPEARLMTRRNDVTAISFKGNLEISTPAITEYDKEEFVTVLKEQVSYYELNSLFSMADSAGKAHNLTTEKMMKRSLIREIDATISEKLKKLKCTDNEVRSAIKAAWYEKTSIKYLTILCY